MKICYFGNYNPEYSRNKVIIKGLRENGAEVLECRVNKKSGVARLWELYKMHRKFKGEYDFLIVGYSDTSRFLVVLAKILTRKKVVWDAFYSVYDSWVFDRRLVSKWSLKARYYWVNDWLACKFTDRILLDTNAHIDYFVKTFGIRKDKFVRVLVGSLAGDYAREGKRKEGGKIKVVGFYGSFVPLQGVEYIVRAVKKLENNKNIRFEIIGSGQEYKRIMDLVDELGVTNIDFVAKMSYEKLVERVNNWDICLGVFGDSDKARRVIPNKVYDAIALEKPVVTADTEGVRELFTDRENIVLCKSSDGDDLADKILELVDSEEMREEIRRNGKKVFESCGKPEIIACKLIKCLSK